jgi:predicted CXXCH cytochrome family protein
MKSNNHQGHELPQRITSCKFVSFVVYAFPRLFSIVFLGTLATPAFCADHTPVSNAAACQSCHTDKFRGASVHSAMEAPCTTCHFVQTENAKTGFVLAMTKEQICFACHEKATILGQHTPQIQKEQICVSCHDSHSSDHPMLLLATGDARYRASHATNPSHSRNGKLGASSSHPSAPAAKSAGSE